MFAESQILAEAHYRRERVQAASRHRRRIGGQRRLRSRFRVLSMASKRLSEARRRPRGSVNPAGAPQPAYQPPVDAGRFLTSGAPGSPR